MGTAARARPIGIFDSGVGGLSVLRELRGALPGESVVYLGDTARVPYGTKSPRSIQRYALQAAEKLVERGIKLLIVACNTVSAVALEDLRKRLEPVAVVGVIAPAADAAVRHGRSGRYLVLATESTVERGAYAAAIAERDPGAPIEEIACSLLVPLAEEGWTDGPIVEAVTARYLEAAPHARHARSVILGCTHFGLLEAVLRRQLGDACEMFDSARTAAQAVRRELEQSGLLERHGRGGVTFLVTDSPDRFARVGSAFLGEALCREDVAWIDL